MCSAAIAAQNRTPRESAGPKVVARFRPGEGVSPSLSFSPDGRAVSVETHTYQTAQFAFHRVRGPTLTANLLLSLVGLCGSSLGEPLVLSVICLPHVF